MDRQVRQAVLGALAGLLDLPDGRLLLPSKATDVVDEFRYFGMLRVSHDMGETREYGGRICEDPVAHFSAPTSTPSGRLLVLYRGHTGALGPQRARAGVHRAPGLGPGIHGPGAGAGHLR